MIKTKKGMLPLPLLYGTSCSPPSPPPPPQPFKGRNLNVWTHQNKRGPNKFPSSNSQYPLHLLLHLISPPPLKEIILNALLVSEIPSSLCPLMQNGVISWRRIISRYL